MSCVEISLASSHGKTPDLEERPSIATVKSGSGNDVDMDEAAKGSKEILKITSQNCYQEQSRFKKCLESLVVYAAFLRDGRGGRGFYKNTKGEKI